MTYLILGNVNEGNWVVRGQNRHIKAALMKKYIYIPSFLLWCLVLRMLASRILGGGQLGDGGEGRQCHHHWDQDHGDRGVSSNGFRVGQQ